MTMVFFLNLHNEPITGLTQVPRIAGTDFNKIPWKSALLILENTEKIQIGNFEHQPTKTTF